MIVRTQLCQGCKGLQKIEKRYTRTKRKGWNQGIEVRETSEELGGWSEDRRK